MADPKIQILKNKEAFETGYKYKWFEHYKASIKFDGSLSCTSALDTFEQARIRNIDGFKDIKTPKGSSLAETLNTAVAGEPGAEVKAAIAKALTDVAASTQATRDEFKKDITDLNKLLSDKKPRFHPGEIGRYLLDLKSDAVIAIKDQHTKAKAELSALFDDQKFKQDLAGSKLNYTNPNDLKDEMLLAMDKNNKEELEKLEKTINEDAKKLFKAAEDNYYRLSYLGYKKKAHDTMKKIILENTPPAENAEDGAAHVVINGQNGGDITLKNVDPNKFAKFDTINHGRISTYLGLSAYLDRTIQKTENGFSMRLDSRWDSDETILEDLTSFCQTIKACGKDKITLTINNENEEKGLEHARLAFEAAIDAGFDPKNVTIKFGSKTVMSYDDKGVMNKESDLFKEHGSRLNHITGKAVKIQKEVKQFIEGEEKGETGKKVKEALVDMRAKAEEEARQAARAGAGANPSSTNR